VNRLKIFVDPEIPESKGAFDHLGDIVPFEAANFHHEQAADADVLVIRSTTKVDGHLLAATRNLKAIGTPVIGLDHIDLQAVHDFEIMHNRRLPIVNAPGATAGGVADWVMAALANALGINLSPSSLCVGIVGFGHCGQAVAQRLDKLKINWIAVDPPKQALQEPGKWSTYEDLAQCQVITLHVPLTKPSESKWPTLQMVNQQFVSGLSSCKCLINSSRGPVLDEKLILANQNQIKFCLDVFNNEPTPNADVIQAAHFATPHIAGNVIEGRQRAVKMVVTGLEELFFKGWGCPKQGSNMHAPVERSASQDKAPSPADVTSELGHLAVSFKSDYCLAKPEIQTQVFKYYRSLSMRREVDWGL